MPIPDVSRETYNLSLIMWHFVHISTLKKKRQENQSLSAAPPREFQCAQRKNRFGLQKKSYLQKKIIRFARKSHSGCPFACQTVTALSALMSLLYRPHAYKRDISLLATTDFHASSRFFAAISLVSCLYYQF